MKVEAFTLEKAHEIKRQQEKMKKIAEKGKGMGVELVNADMPEVYEAEVVDSLSFMAELPENGGIIENWLKRRGIESNTKLYRAFNDKKDQVYRARNMQLELIRQDEALENLRRQSELAKIDHVIALKEKRIHLDFLNKIETSKKDLILAALTRMIEEHRAETRLQIAKANARARNYEDS